MNYPSQTVRLLYNCKDESEYCGILIQILCFHVSLETCYPFENNLLILPNHTIQYNATANNTADRRPPPEHRALTIFFKEVIEFEGGNIMISFSPCFGTIFFLKIRCNNVTKQIIKSPFAQIQYYTRGVR